MHDQSKAKLRRLSIWLALNLVVFVACYLNYRLQLKHRYLYKTLSVGLCLSRAAAMVINFNLILVWLPMCKYTLTKLAVLACHSNSNLKAGLNCLISAQPCTRAEGQGMPQLSFQESKQVPCAKSQGAKSPPVPVQAHLLNKLNWALGRVGWRVKCQLYRLKINTINSFLVAVDHATSLHTICATTITLASVIHTIAHLMNVINFSNNYDPLLDNLNMAEFRGQNPLHLLVSVPGITGCLMIVILFLMSLSSISSIRNSSFDLFQIFHRLSVLFVVLLILHPSSHVLKEQVNVDRHNPDVCYDRMLVFRDGTLATRANGSLLGLELRGDSQVGLQPHVGAPATNRLDATDSWAENFHDVRQRTSSESFEEPQRAQRGEPNSRRDLKSSHLKRETTIPVTANITDPTRDLTSRLQDAGSQASHEPGGRSSRHSEIYVQPDQSFHDDDSTSREEDLCLDLAPRFAPQSSLCWSRNPIELLDARSDSEGNLMELVLSNNHKRFAHWLPGQFVYLNCPQIAAYEWHPFTISSMDNRTRQFTLHIKAGGDWTRKLRDELELRQSQRHDQYGKPEPPVSSGLTCPGGCHPHEKQNSMSLFSQVHECGKHSVSKGPSSSRQRGSKIGFGQALNFRSLTPSGRRYASINVVATFDCCDQGTGQSQVQCRKLVCLANGDNGQTGKQRQFSSSGGGGGGGGGGGCCVHTPSPDCVRIALDGGRQEERRLRSICGRHSLGPAAEAAAAAAAPCAPPAGYHQPALTRCLTETQAAMHGSLDLFIDGPFHSPFERLLEQQVSVCIANGVGWTAFSSVFQQIINNQYKRAADKDAWWAQWRNYLTLQAGKGAGHSPGCCQRASSADNGGQAATAPPDAARSTTVDIKQKLSHDTKLHILIIVTTIEQLRPFYKIAMRYFEHLRLGFNTAGASEQSNPVKDITAFITRSTKGDADVIEFCRTEKLHLDNNSHGADETIKVNDLFLIRFGKPNFDAYLQNFSNLYRNRRKISIYCCGSYQVKRTVEDICRHFNKQARSSTDKMAPRPTYLYHEENF